MGQIILEQNRFVMHGTIEIYMKDSQDKIQIVVVNNVVRILVDKQTILFNKFYQDRKKITYWNCLKKTNLLN